MTIALGKFTKKTKKDLFDIMDDWLRGTASFCRFVWSIALSLCLFRFGGLVHRYNLCNFMVYSWIG
uniref:Uncharacterized protein n=1 Tax=Brassica oleracea TaxID=3712 RepID=A0A3P6E896_BRAOL|nr:unnamed protein product [Brassica oleracea]